MRVAVIGTGFIGGVLGRAMAGAGHDVVFGTRNPDAGGFDPGQGTVAPIAEALSGADAVVLALPGAAVGDLAAAQGDALDGRLVIDATNQMGKPVGNGRSALPPGVRYARAFNTLGGENMADPVFPDGRADMFFSSPAGDEETVATVIESVGLRPVYVGEDKEALIDGLFQLWIALAMGQGRGRRLAFRLLEG